MPWVRDRDELRMVGQPHYDIGKLRALIRELRQSRNRPARICNLLETLLSTGRASKELVWRLSKWSHWNDPSESIAQEIARRLFHEHICRRLRDQQDNPIPDRTVANADYQIWLKTVIETSHRTSVPQ